MTAYVPTVLKGAAGLVTLGLAAHLYDQYEVGDQLTSAAYAGADFASDSAESTSKLAQHIFESTDWYNVGTSIASGAWVFATGLYQLRNIWNGNQQDGSGPYSNVFKKAFQATLNAVTAVAVVSLFQTMKTEGSIYNPAQDGMFNATHGTLPEAGAFNATANCFDQFYDIAGNSTGPYMDSIAQATCETLKEYGLPLALAAKTMILSTIASVGSISMLSNIMTSNSQFSQPYGSFAKRAFGAFVIAATAISFRNLYLLYPETGNAVLSATGAGLQFAAKHTPWVTSNAAHFGWEGVKILGKVAMTAYRLFG